MVITISSSTVYGIRHGMETLFQLLVPYTNKETQCLGTVSSVSIVDKPVYRHRGLLIDSARHFLSVKTIKKNIDGMACSKMNVLHWHISDTQSFPMESKRLPNMTKLV